MWLDPAALGELERFARTLIEDAGQLALDHFRRQPEVTDKSPAGAALDPVTAADRAVEARIREGIRARYPDHGLFGEEAEDEPGSSDFAWMIDPIDGTRGFMSGFVHWGVLLALRHRSEPVLGLVHQPYTGETWSGAALGAHFYRGAEVAPMRTRDCGTLGAVVLATTDPYLFEGAEAAAFESLRQQVRLTRYGADCYAYCMLAMGQLDLVVESGLKPWDVQALIPIITAAGGVISNWRGGDCRDGGQVLAAGDAVLHRAALARLAEAAN
ncbi:MAG: inositol monophosphatase family protein [Gammaproteobacteria bacterium]|nr:MAG: inositol monophosphatase family protein [Gammaproteobacteria bacterium]